MGQSNVVIFGQFDHKVQHVEVRSARGQALDSLETCEGHFVAKQPHVHGSLQFVQLGAVNLFDEIIRTISIGLVK